MREHPTALLQRSNGAGWRVFSRPIETLIARRSTELRGVLESAERAAQSGLTACGFLTYEAAPAFDKVLRTHPAGSLPLAWFGLFEPAQISTVRTPGRLVPQGQSFWHSDWQPSVDRKTYEAQVRRIREWISRGDTYQVNYTLRLRAAFTGDPFTYFASLASGTHAGHGAWVDTGRHAICSLSPELFFRLEGEHLEARPMKGTARRGVTTSDDLRISEALSRSAKDRAENVMIVDMVRNDLGRIAKTGAVRVNSLCDVERYPRVFQMTSTCEASSTADLADIFAALYPSASITGAPKVRTMELITAAEDCARGIYTGSIGSIGPGRRAAFNVAIRTVHIDRQEGSAEYGTGGGIVWDSTPSSEFRECLAKALVVTSPDPEFDLLETMRWDPGTGIVLLDRHLQRLADSARYFDRALDLEAVRRRLDLVTRDLVTRDLAEPHRLRLLVDVTGRPNIEILPLSESPSTGRLALAPTPIDPDDRFLYHKTTHRAVYERAREECPGADDTLLWNHRGEITESTIANVVVERFGERLTPEVRCGLLPGTMRAELLERGEIREAVIHRDALADAEALFLINSVRGWTPAVLLGAPETLEAHPT
jgi:para-aminobenzoate synthetase/4-amino-4-deoxychorismate lyase